MRRKLNLLFCVGVKFGLSGYVKISSRGSADTSNGILLLLVLAPVVRQKHREIGTHAVGPVQLKLYLYLDDGRSSSF